MALRNNINLRGFSAYRLWTQLPRVEISYLPDLLMFAAAIALFYGVLQVARTWFGPFTPEVEISRSLWALPAYAGYSLLRIAIAYGLSLAFTLVYGYVAAYNPKAERFMIPLLDVLQSIPVLSFLPGVMMAMVALFPGRQLGVEAGAIRAAGQLDDGHHIREIPRRRIECDRIVKIIRNVGGNA